MRQVLFALIPGVLAYVWYFGPGVIINIALALAVVLAEAGDAAAAQSSPAAFSQRLQRRGHRGAAGPGAAAAGTGVADQVGVGLRHRHRQASVRGTRFQSLQSGHGRLCRAADFLSARHDPVADAADAERAHTELSRNAQRHLQRPTAGRNRLDALTGATPLDTSKPNSGRARPERDHAARRSSATSAGVAGNGSPTWLCVGRVSGCCTGG